MNIHKGKSAIDDVARKEAIDNTDANIEFLKRLGHSTSSSAATSSVMEHQKKKMEKRKQYDESDFNRRHDKKFDSEKYESILFPDT